MPKHAVILTKVDKVILSNVRQRYAEIQQNFAENLAVCFYCRNSLMEGLTRKTTLYSLKYDAFQTNRLNPY